jgi:hypothetical protein
MPVGKRKSSDDPQQPTSKRTRARTLFRVARPVSHFASTSESSTSSSHANSSRVTRLRRTVNGRLSQRKTEQRAQTPTDDHPMLEETVDVNTMQMPANDSTLDTDSTVVTPVGPMPKQKRKRKNTISVSFSPSTSMFARRR